ncbi:MAG: hypothetical protein QXJ74_01595 [Nitrososphaera sp.]
MQNQKATDYWHVSDGLFSANDKVRYVAVVNMFGEVTQCFARSPHPPQGEISRKFQRVAFAINALAFENVRFMLLNEDDLVLLIVNLGEDTLVVGMDKNTPWPKISAIIGRLSA